MTRSALAVRPAHTRFLRGATAICWHGWFLMVLVGFMAMPAWALESVPMKEDPAGLLLKVQAAAREADYAGVYIYQQGTTMQSSRIVHIVDGTGERERLEMLDGAPRECVRHNDTMQCFLPEKKLVVTEQQRADRFPGLLLGDAKNVAAFYNFEVAQSRYRIAGHECTLIHVVPKDGLRYGYNICIDIKTNLLLKAQTVNGEDVIDQIAFTSLQVGKSVQPDQLLPQWDTKDWKRVQVPTEAVDITQLGWRIASPSGFDYVTQVSRLMKSGTPVKQLVLTDGLAAISVFIESYDASRNSTLLPKGARHNGAINIFGARIGDHWLTAIGEVPMVTLRELVQRTEYVPPVASPQ